MTRPPMSGLWEALDLPSGVSAVELNITAIDSTTTASYFRAFAAGTTRPSVSTVNVSSGTTRITTSYCYTAGRVISATDTTGGHTYTYSYDTDGNRSSEKVDAAATLTHGYNTANQQNNTGSDSGFAFDGTGDTTTMPGASFGYNGYDQTATITAGSDTFTYTYAGTDQTGLYQASSTGITDTYENGALGVQSRQHACTGTCAVTTWFERDPQGAIIAIIDKDSTGTDHYYSDITDATDSVTGLIDTTGTQQATYGYDPYGAHSTAVNPAGGALPTNPLRYAAGLDITDDNGAAPAIYKYGARDYTPALGRFTTQDPLNILNNPARGNRYAYAGDNPINNIDPSGQFSFGEAVSDVGNVIGLASAAPGPEGAIGGLIGATLQADGTYLQTNNSSDAGSVFEVGLISTAAGQIGGPPGYAAVRGLVTGFVLGNQEPASEETQCLVYGSIYNVSTL